MAITRRTALSLMASCAPAVLNNRAQAADALKLEIAKGPFEGTRDSLAKYETPEWFRDAKLGMWAHWGPQSAPEQGDWYAQRMYLEGSPDYLWHVANIGHPSKLGYQAVIPTFKADKWNPSHLMDLYVKAGAKYFVSMGVHHDNFDLWNSKYQPRWNSVAAGPRKDIVGLWREEARKRGLKFGVSEHLSNSFDWFAAAHRSDKNGPLAGVPYDGTNPAFADLYHNYKDMPASFAQDAKPMGREAPDAWKMQYFRRIKDLVDQHEPDLLYTDGPIPFEEYGLALVAHHYNVSAHRNGGKVQAIYNSKRQEDCAEGTCTLDLERGIVDKIWPKPWQTDTCIGNWHYKRGIVYKTPKIVVDMLVDIVSRNGNLLLNFPLPASGQLDENELSVVSALTNWMKVNSEGIYATRPWTIYGEGPGTLPAMERPGRLGFNERLRKDLTAEDVRFTTKDNVLYAFVMGWPGQKATVKALGSSNAQQTKKILNVQMLGHSGNLKWNQEAAGLTVNLPSEKPCDHAFTLKITLA